MPNTGTARLTALRMSGSVVASRAGSCSVPGSLGCALVVLRLDVRGAAGEQQPVEPLQQLVEAELLGQRGDQQRCGVRGLEHGAGILLPDHVKRVCADHAPVGGNTDEWTNRCHGVSGRGAV